MQDVKSLFASRTFWGVVVTGVSLILGIWGRSIGPEDQEILVEAGATAAGLVGSIIAVVGRITATKAIRQGL